MIKSAWNKISNVGIREEHEGMERKSILFSNRIGAVIWLVAFISVIINLLLDSYIFIPVLLIALVLISLSYLLNYKGFVLAGKINVVVTVILLLLYMSAKGGYGSGLEYYFFSLITFMVFIFNNRKLIYLFQIICLGCLIFQKFYVESIGVPPHLLAHDVFYVFNTISSSVLVIIAVLFFKKITQKSEGQLATKNIIIEEKNVQLEASNKQLDMFAYSVSHDLKAPLRSIEGFASLFEKRHEKDLIEEDKDILHRIQNNAVHMRNLIESLLLFSRSMKVEMKVSEVNMEELAKMVASSYKDVIDQCKITLTIDSLPPALADRALLIHVFDNLISNAIKYSKKEAQPCIKIGFDISKVEMNVYFVQDNGVGFNMAYAHKLFNPFQRLHNQIEYEGTGVGLTIVKNIIQRHNGDVWVEAAEGEGATFYFSLPKSPGN